ncbi:MCM DNA helicase complex subunit MCM5 [Sugiyamaella lignohabitans]|uniref:DNA replication licensing factor MCM5 n=1 Tax=Sugiyamaella lignohabitans TaxID=796027 RepID=A0A167D2B2_9ASCO|nr:MCM DNA helicase complex subunit MCM5 [Sugiyamaella lignohabitans]ANB12391.1 MCM DNA helicase complex subunit MCM5 [Sugiyamaella lignohabitans]
MSYDQARVYSTSVYPREESETTPRFEILNLFKQFIQEFWIENRYIYRQQLRENVLIRKYSLTVDVGHVLAFDEDLGQKLTDEPGEMLPIFENAAREIAKRIVYPSEVAESENSADENRQNSLASIPMCQIILTSSSSPISIRDLSAKYISKLVRIPGIVIGASTLSSKATQLQLICRNCRHVYRMDVGGGFSGLQLPRNCLGPAPPGGEPKTCPMDPYVIVHDRSTFIDQQVLKLQEAPDMVPVGEMPRHILLSADRYLTNRIIPGTRCTINGIYSIYQNKVKGQSAVAIRNPYVRVVGIQTDLERDIDHSSSVFTEEEEEEFLALSRTPDLYEKFSQSIAPSIYGSTDIKKAITCLLMGGSRKFLPDGMRLRGDINVLLLGDPGTAKSQLLKFVEKVSPIAIYTSGKGSSAAGLTASVQRESSSREFYLEGGAMVLADGGVVCIDEFDKMRDEDRVAIHEAMEQQTISIAKAGITTILNSRTSVLAAANPVFGRYDDMKSPGENIDFQTTILSRFDMIFIVKDDHDQARDRTIAKHVLETHINGNSAAVEVEGEIPIDKMKRYISYCRTKCAPRLSPEASEKLASHFVGIRKQVHQKEVQVNERSSVPITVRQLEAVIRITESIAKLHLSPVANEQHVDEAIRLFYASTMDAVGQDGESRQDLIQEVAKIEEELKRRLPVGWSTSYQTLLREFVNGPKNYQKYALDRALDVLERRDTIQFRHQRSNILRVGV